MSIQYVTGPPGPPGSASSWVILYSPGAVPTPSSGLVGQFIVVKQLGTASLIKVCLSNSSGGYEWVTLSQSS